MTVQSNQPTFQTRSLQFQVPQGWIAATAIAGVVAGGIFQQALLSSVPLSLSLLMVEANRRRSEQQIEQMLGAQNQLASHITEKMQALGKELAALQQAIATPEAKARPLTHQHLLPMIQQIHKLQVKHKQLELGYLHQQQQELARVDAELKAMAAALNALQEKLSEVSEGRGQAAPGPSQSAPQANQLAIFIDAANLYHCAQELGLKVDYEQLLPRLQAGFKESRILFYTGVRSGDLRQQRFLATLRKWGCEVITKQVLRRGDGTEKANLDVELALDLVALSKQYQHLMLLSGDSDLACAVRIARQQGAQVRVVSFRSRTSQTLIKAADHYRDLAGMVESLEVNGSSPAGYIPLVG